MSGLTVGVSAHFNYNTNTPFAGRAPQAPNPLARDQRPPPDPGPLAAGADAAAAAGSRWSPRRASPPPPSPTASRSTISARPPIPHATYACVCSGRAAAAAKGATTRGAARRSFETDLLDPVAVEVDVAGNVTLPGTRYNAATNSVGLNGPVLLDLHEVAVTATI